MNSDVIDIRLLEAFAAVMSAGSITGAARLLGRSQPVVTRQIQDLEAEVGYPLFSRNGPRISPTPKGVLFHAEVERLLMGLKHIRQRANAIGAGALPVLSLAAIPALAAGFVPAALASLERELLPSQVHVQALSAENVVQSVLSQSVDFGLASLPVQHPGLDVQWVCEVPCVACLAMDHPLAKKKVIRLKDIGGGRLLTMANPYRLRRRVDEALERVAVVPAEVIDTNSSMTAIAMAKQSLGIAIVEPVLTSSLPVEGVVTRRLDVAIPFLFAALSPTGRELTPTVAAVNGALRAAVTLMPGAKLHSGAAASLDPDGAADEFEKANS
ncbi:LysR family transcriptional regulator [Bradyrhizobium sp. GCM10027634]|uniref:LysR family transcriptional regulator n=1 Tax=unclassified Bradyrhizobium TaxID=2631580 RepID=UPI00188A1826|nr:MULTISPECIES: LysR family transcriptional regulator [unclassified Bradyrhizobium]MDN5000742.1 LysR family transcriptional regulator [Bradyrhizobium sp. WYCCWR 12677]QOZ42539.1 LysR family transcriptional regulator [Bradyrhizobium sp. CCBAU 53340]